MIKTTEILSLLVLFFPLNKKGFSVWKENYIAKQSMIIMEGNKSLSWHSKDHIPLWIPNIGFLIN